MPAAYANGSSVEDITTPMFADQLEKNRFTANELHGQAMSAVRSGQRMSGILWQFERAVRLDTGNATLWNDLGVAHLHMQNWVKAYDCFTTSLELDHTFAGAANNKRQIDAFADAGGLQDTGTKFNIQIGGRDNADEQAVTSASTSVPSPPVNLFSREYSRSLLGKSSGLDVDGGLHRRQQHHQTRKAFSSDSTGIRNNAVSCDSEAPSCHRCDRASGVQSVRLATITIAEYTRLSSSSNPSTTISESTSESDEVPPPSPSPISKSSTGPQSSVASDSWSPFTPFVIIGLINTTSWRLGENREKGSRFWRLWALPYLQKHFGRLKGQFTRYTIERQQQRMPSHYRCDDDAAARRTASDASSACVIGEMTRTTLLGDAASDIQQLMRERSRSDGAIVGNLTAAAFFSSGGSCEPTVTTTTTSSAAATSSTTAGIRGSIPLALNEWASLTAETGELPPGLGRDADDPVLQCLSRTIADSARRAESSSRAQRGRRRRDTQAGPRLQSRMADPDATDGTAFPRLSHAVISEFMALTGWRRLEISSARFGAAFSRETEYDDGGDHDGCDEFELSISHQRHRRRDPFKTALQDLQLLKYSIGAESGEQTAAICEWYVQVKGTSRWVMCASDLSGGERGPGHGENPLHSAAGQGETNRSCSEVETRLADMVFIPPHYSIHQEAMAEPARPSAAADQVSIGLAGFTLCATVGAASLPSSKSPAIPATTRSIFQRMSAACRESQQQALQAQAEQAQLLKSHVAVQADPDSNGSGGSDRGWYRKPPSEALCGALEFATSIDCGG